MTRRAGDVPAQILRSVLRQRPVRIPPTPSYEGVDAHRTDVMKMRRSIPNHRFARATLVVQVLQFLATAARALAEWTDLLRR
jgi:hypothetical protein